MKHFSYNIIIFIGILISIYAVVHSGIFTSSTGNIIGCIKCDSDSTKIIGLYIDVYNKEYKSKIILTDQKFIITSLPEGYYSLKASMIGLESRQYDSIRVASDSASIVLIHTHIDMGWEPITLMWKESESNIISNSYIDTFTCTENK
jgi:hypothetical protein